MSEDWTVDSWFARLVFPLYLCDELMCYLNDLKQDWDKKITWWLALCGCDTLYVCILSVCALSLVVTLYCSPHDSDRMHIVKNSVPGHFHGSVNITPQILHRTNIISLTETQIYHCIYLKL